MKLAFFFLRILAFTPGSVTNIEVYIDEVHIGKAKPAEGPLYVLPWRPDKYSKGVHSIRVVVQVICRRSVNAINTGTEVLSVLTLQC